MHEAQPVVCSAVQQGGGEDGSYHHSIVVTEDGCPVRMRAALGLSDSIPLQIQRADGHVMQIDNMEEFPTAVGSESLFGDATAEEVAALFYDEGLFCKQHLPEVPVYDSAILDCGFKWPRSYLFIPSIGSLIHSNVLYLRWCNIVRDGRIYDNIGQAQLVKIVQLIPAIGKLVECDVSGKLVVHSACTNLTVKHVTSSIETNDNPLQRRHADAAGILGIDRFVYYCGSFVSTDRFNKFCERYAKGIILMKNNTENFGISNAAGNMLTRRRNQTVADSALEGLSQQPYITHDYAVGAL